MRVRFLEFKFQDHRLDLCDGAEIRSCRPLGRAALEKCD